MNLLHPVRRGPLVVMLALLLASATAVGLVTVRIVCTGRWSHGFLVWNLFLAWTPLAFAFLAVLLAETNRKFPGRFLGAATAWLLLFPNAPYLFTDLIHLGARHHTLFWVDLVLILVFALTGLMVGFVSLHLMHTVVARQCGARRGWLFVMAVAGLSGWGVYIGRFLRWNSWDVLVQPVALFTDLASWLARVPTHPLTAALPALFALFIFVGYVMFHALTRLHWERAVDGESRHCRLTKPFFEAY